MSETWSTLLLIATTVAITVLPIWYPKHSIFIRKSRDGLQKLSELNNSRNVTSDEFTLPSNMDGATQNYGVIQEGDTGFSQIRKSILSHTELHFRPVRFELVHHCPEGSNILIGEGGEVRKAEQAYLKAEGPSGESIRIVESPSFEIDRTLQLKRPREWVSDHTRRRSHLGVTALALVWGTASIISVLPWSPTRGLSLVQGKIAIGYKISSCRPRFCPPVIPSRRR